MSTENLFGQEPWARRGELFIPSRTIGTEHFSAAVYGSPTGVASANADGTAVTLARSDHVHDRYHRMQGRGVAASATQGPFTAMTDIDGMVVTNTWLANAWIHIYTKVSFTTSAASTGVTLYIREGATLRDTGRVITVLANEVHTVWCDLWLQNGASTVSRTFKASMIRHTGAGTITTFNTGDDICAIVALDVS